jgi:hypothetical protein
MRRRHSFHIIQTLVIGVLTCPCLIYCVYKYFHIQTLVIGVWTCLVCSSVYVNCLYIQTPVVFG